MGLLRNENRLDEALATIRQLFLRAPSDPAIARLASVIAAEAGEATTALTFAEEWRRRSRPNTALADVAIANLQLQLGRVQDALPWAQRELDDAIKDENIAKLTLVCRILVAGGLESQVRAVAEQMASYDTGWAMVSLDWIVSGLPTPEDERAWLNWANSVTEPTPDSTRRVAAAWFSLARRTNSEADSQQVIDLLESLAADGRLHSDCAMIAASYTSVDDLNSAAHWYAMAIDLGGENTGPLVLNNAVYVDWQLNRVNPESLVHIESAITQIRQLVRAGLIGNAILESLLDTKGLVQLALDQPEAALGTYDEALSLPTDDSKAGLQVGRAEALLQLGRMDEAASELDAIQNLGPIDAALQARVDQLQTSMQ